MFEIKIRKPDWVTPGLCLVKLVKEPHHLQDMGPHILNLVWRVLTYPVSEVQTLSRVPPAGVINLKKCFSIFFINSLLCCWVMMKCEGKWSNFLQRKQYSAMFVFTRPLSSGGSYFFYKAFIVVNWTKIPYNLCNVVNFISQSIIKFS